MSEMAGGEQAIKITKSGRTERESVAAANETFG